MRVLWLLTVARDALAKGKRAFTLATRADEIALLAVGPDATESEVLAMWRGMKAEHQHERSYVDEACDGWRCECGAWMPREDKS